jgi:hypothetical protein
MKLTHENVRSVLRECGPLTSREIARFFPGDRHQSVAAVVVSLRKAAKQQVYVHSWTRESVESAREYLRAVYALGNRRDAKKPAVMTNAERCARWKARTARPNAPTSVWDLAR